MKGKLTAIVLTAVIIGVLFLSRTGEIRAAGTETENNALFDGLKIVLDAGHGGIDGGVVGIVTKTKEAEVNLSVTYKLKKLLESVGVQVFLTRTDERALCADDIYTKKLDMRLRGELIAGVKPDIIVSIHMNSYPDPSVKGAQTFYYPDSESGEQLATMVQNRLKEFLDPTNKRIAKGEDFFLFRTYSSPSVLVECGFMTCPEEEALLLTDEYQDMAAYAVFCGLVDYIAAVS